MTTKVESPKDL